MRGRVQPHGRFVVALWRRDEIHDARLAPDGVRALHAALVMLAPLGALEDGDRLTVVEDRAGSPKDDDKASSADLPEANRSSHYSSA
jgi:hypothetical protein